jgi:hypothetical protein
MITVAEALCQNSQCGHTADAHWDNTGSCAGHMHPCSCKMFLTDSTEQADLAEVILQLTADWDDAPTDHVANRLAEQIIAAGWRRM